jgi:uncharacterized protein YqiB (DUF1249 family)
LGRQRHDIGVRKRARRVPKKRLTKDEKDRIDQIREEWANWCRVRGHPRRCTCVYRGR